jgi:hypothetical protein
VARKLDGELETICKVSSRPARKAPPTPADFRDVAATEGLGAAAALLQSVRKEAPETLPSFEEPLVLLGYEVLAKGDTRLAIETFRLAVAAFPDSIDGSWGLGKASLAGGFLEEAARSYGAARLKVEKSPDLSAEQKAGILSRVDKILADIRVKTEAKS